MQRPHDARALERLRQATELQPTCTEAWLALANYWSLRGAPDKQRLQRLWVDIFGLAVKSTFVSERENVDEDIERAAVERELRPMFQAREEALAGGMSEAAWDEYQADLFLAKERAKDELIAASDERARSTMNRARRESLDMKAEEAEAREEMQPQVEAEVQAENLLNALLKNQELKKQADE